MSSSDWQTDFPWPVQAISVDGQRYAYVDQGEGSSPIVAVHGNPTWSFYWRRLFDAFASEQRVLAVDHIGCGRSDKPQQYKYTLAQHQANLLAWMEALDLRNITLVVHDWGGAIGLGAAVKAPERIGKIIITNTGAFPPPYIPRRIAACRIPLLGTLAVRGFNLFAKAAVRMATHRYTKLPKLAAEGLLAPYDSWKHRVAIDRFVQDIPSSPSHPTFQTLNQLESDLPSLGTKPTLLIWGMQDWCFRPECLDRFKSLLPNASVRMLEDVGHYVMEDAPDEAIQAMREFLQ